MADKLDAKAVISAQIEGIREVLQALNQVEQGIGSVSDISDQLNRINKNLAGASKGIVDAGAAAKKGGADARSAATGWDAYSEALQKASKEQRRAAQGAAMSQFSAESIGKLPAEMSSEDRSNYLRAMEANSDSAASAIRRLEKSERDAAQAERDWAVAGQRLDSVQRERAQREAAEANRQMEIRAAVEQRARAERELTRRLEQQAAMQRNASQASMYSTARPGSYLGSGAESGLKAADTSWVKDYEAQVAKLADTTSPRLRYALYDVASTAGAVSAALIASGSAVAVLSAQYESAFTNVERTLDGASVQAVSRLREELIGLTREIPLAFSDVAEIATLGNQLGIASGDIAQFTETVSKFSAVTGLTAEASAQAFGSLGELLNVSASEYENLGSSIALVGRRSVATEAEIVSMTTRLAASATNAGFTAEQVVALSGAFASLRIAPERAQGVMEVYFNRLNTAIAEGGPRLEAFATYAGMAVGQVEVLARNNPVEFFERLATGLGKLDQVAQTGALEELGLQGIRAGEVFGRVSANVDVFNQALQDANQGWVEGTELGYQYAKVVDDLASKWQIFLNAVAEAGQAVGNVLAPAIKAALDILTQLFQGFAQLTQTPVGAWAVGAATVLGGIVAVLALLATGGAVAGASMLALRNVMVEAGIVSVGTATGFRGLIAMMTGLGTAAGVSTGAMTAFKVALASTGIGLAVVALGTLAAAFMSVSQSADAAFNQFVGSTAGLGEALAEDTAAYQQAVIDGNQALADSYVRITPALQENSSAQDENQQAIANTAAVLGMVAPSFDAVNAAIAENTQYLGDNTIAWIKNQLLQNESFRQLAGNADFTEYWTTIGANMEDVIRLSATGGQQAVIDYFQSLENTAIAAGKKFQSAFLGSSSFLDRGAVGNQFQGPAGFFGNVQGRTLGSILDLTSGLTGQLSLLATNGNKAGTSLATGANDASSAYENLNRTIGGGGGGGGGGTVEKIRTLVDYSNDLEKVMKRAFDLRFGNQQALDQITSGWSKIRQAAADAREEAEKYRAQLADLAADRAIKEYWLMVAENYGDSLRAGKLRAELAELDEKQADAQKKLNAAQGKTNKTLEGTSDAAIANRAEILGLVGNYQAYLQALAASGMSQSDLQAQSTRLRSEFVQQAVSLGYNRTEVEKYARAFDDMNQIIAKVPRNLTLSVNANPAIQALAEYEAAINKARANAGRGISMGAISNPTNGKEVRRAALEAQVAAMNAMMKIYLSIGQVPSAMSLATQIGVIAANLRSGNYWTGGYTGDGGKFEPKGIVHGGEFVFSKQATKNMGVNNLNYMHNMARAGKGMGPVGLGAASGMVELSPYDRMLLQTIADRVGLSVEGLSLQAITNGANANAAMRRSA